MFTYSHQPALKRGGVGLRRELLRTIRGSAAVAAGTRLVARVSGSVVAAPMKGGAPPTTSRYQALRDELSKRRER
jgi:hypothetical protein